MGFVEGVVWSLLGAVVHTIIDVLRKFAAQRLPPTDLIALLTLYNAAFAVLGVWLIDGGLPNMQDMPNISLFSKAVVATACMGLTAAVLYQRALSIAPLSLTVPYLAFAPVFVVFVSPMFLVGEVPSAMGLCGVAVVSIAGYKLGVLGAADAAALSQQAGKTAKAKLPLLPVGSHAVNGCSTAAAGKALQHDEPGHSEAQMLIPAAELRGRVGESASCNGQQQQSRVYQRQPAQLLPPPSSSPELHTPNGSRQEVGRDSAAQHESAQHGEELQQLLQSEVTSAGGARSSSGGTRHKSAWAIAYYKQKSPPVGVWEAACGGLQSAAQQLLLATAGMSPRSQAASSARNVFGAHTTNSQLSGHSNGHSVLVGSTDDPGSSSAGGSGWLDSQAKAGKDHKLDSKRGVGAGQRSSRARRLPVWLRGPLNRLQAAIRGPLELLSGPSAGPALVLIVAFLYSLNASLDKLGMSSSCSTAFYLMMQRLLIAAASLVYFLLGSPRTLRHLYRDALLLVTLSLAEQAAIVLYFKAIQNILVSYMVAIKRINVLLSTLVGCVMFNERVGRRMPYILLMLLGMLLIVLQPGHEAMHHSHHTRL